MDPQRHAPGKLVTDSEPGLLLGPAPGGPLLGRHSVQPQGGGCEHRQSTQAQGAPSVRVLGAPTPPASWTPALAMALGGRQSGLLGGPLSAQPHGPKCG